VYTSPTSIQSDYPPVSVNFGHATTQPMCNAGHRMEEISLWSEPFVRRLESLLFRHLIYLLLHRVVMALFNHFSCSGGADPLLLLLSWRLPRKDLYPGCSLVGIFANRTFGCPATTTSVLCQFLCRHKGSCRRRCPSRAQ
jgi:hypothetical protein